MRKRLIACMLTTALLLIGCAVYAVYTTQTLPPAPETGAPAANSAASSAALPPPVIKLQFAGDVLLHSGPIKAASKGDNRYDFDPFFERIDPFVDGDLALCNVETPIDVFGGNRELSTYPRFNAPYEILPTLKKIGFNFFVNANNHSFDKRWDGLLATKENFKKAGVAATGTYASQEDYDRYRIVDVKGIKVGIIAYTDAVNGLEQAIPEERRGYAIRRFSSADTADVPRMIADMEACRAAGAEFIILSLHWGWEYRDAPTDAQREIAALLCKGGADVLMGSHSHCVQPVEWFPGKDGGRSLCAFSLGNFFADQYGLQKPMHKTQFSMLLSATVTRGENGRTVIETADYLPTFTYRARTGGGNYYSLVPAGVYTRSDFYSSSGWDMYREASAHVTKIAGDSVPVFQGATGT
ncbi:MAG: CapA family protein [Oscillospiraceae bacterium]|nr:CapA family protein [Oscillospiraceae bacterium]